MPLLFWDPSLFHTRTASKATTLAVMFRAPSQTPAEAAPAPISTVTKLAPERATSLMMGVWFLATAVGNYLGGRAASLYDTLELPTLFGIVAAIPIGAVRLQGLDFRLQLLVLFFELGNLLKQIFIF